ncbi:MAG TPA: YajQ family cyclic di-GMP-binding protein [Candidatus Dormibacteraeota bacterium]|nr:YajQ family cyclic di-GMP-binding protein [Candidatus Dormibacteraeota bacterium]
MAQEYSFDVVSRYEEHELLNALDQARREVATRFDFKGTDPTIARQDGTIVIEASTEDRARAVYQVLLEKAARRRLPAKLFKAGEPRTVGKGRGRIEVQLNAGIPDDLARALQKRIRAISPRVQVRVQGDQLRVSSKEKDALQAVIRALREDDSIPVPLQFVNYR